ncbi:MAG: L,D-transpeptidase [Pseudomonadota bacterium]|nr:L,D-transpeptidase [Pseudomonadota bacterium]
MDFGKAQPSKDARDVAERVVAFSDAGGLPFLIVDKTAARVLAFDSQGRFVGDSAALLGSARGDDSAPGIGDRPLAKILPEERTTPAGRFSAELGENNHGEDILWVDYDNAISMHRVRSVKASEKRLQRLASPTPTDNRISYGCINVPAAFYDDVVKPLFAPRNGIVYVLPETRPVETLFNTPPVASTR